MQTYVASIGARAVLAFRAKTAAQARAMINESSMQSDLKTLTDMQGKPLWDGKLAIAVDPASAAQHAQWEQSRDQAIRDGEIDLNSGHDPDDWDIYFLDTPRAGKGQRRGRDK
jgi:hypothetical protein